MEGKKSNLYEKWLPIKEISKYMGISESTFRNHYLPHVARELVGRRWFYSVDSAERYRQTKRVRGRY